MTPEALNAQNKLAIARGDAPSHYILARPLGEGIMLEYCTELQSNGIPRRAVIEVRLETSWRTGRTEASVNWSAVGSVPPELALQMGAMLQDAARKAEQLLSEELTMDAAFGAWGVEAWAAKAGAR